MTAKPVALAKARAAKEKAIARIAELEMMNNSWKILFGCLLERAKCYAITFDTDELNAFDDRRVHIVDMSSRYGKVIVGLTESGDEPFKLDFLSKRALKSVEAPPEDSGPVAQPVEQEALNLPVGGSNPSGSAEAT